MDPELTRGRIFAILLGRFEMTINDAIKTFQDLTNDLLERIKNDNAADPAKLTSIFAQKLDEIIGHLTEDTTLRHSRLKCKT